MDRTLSRILLLLSLSAAFGKYVYISENKRWKDAQQYCRTFHTDLAPISNEYDMQLIGKIRRSELLFFGMERHSTDFHKWMWSGGTEVTKFFWDHDQPSNGHDELYGLIVHNKWHDARMTDTVPFICYNAVVVREEKTWEEALGYCRANHRDLASVASETEMLLIHKELGTNITTEHVWVGLRFLSGRWMWMDGQPLYYEVWSQDTKSECPDIKLMCAALMKPNDSAIGTVARTAMNTSQKVWEALDCVERHYFVCY